MDNSRWLWVIAICAMNIVNYMDRFSIAGILTNVQQTFMISDGMAGFLQTVFVLFYTLFAIPFGYVADRYNRKYIIVIGMTGWTASVLTSAFVSENGFPIFLLLRGVGGIGEASFSVAAPTIISDLFSTDQRSQIFMLIFFAIPVGSGIAYVYGATMLNLLSDWREMLYITPIFGAIIVLFVLILLQEPRRDARDQSTAIKRTTSYTDDLRYLIKNKAYIWLTISYPLMLFAVGTIAWFTPTLFIYATCIARNVTDLKLLDKNEQSRINWIFGGITTISGVLGITFGVWLTRFWKKGHVCFARCASYKADVYVAAIGSFSAVPCLIICYLALPYHINIAWIFMFIAFACLCFNWAIIVDFLLYIVKEQHHNVATSWFFLLAHLLGDASGPLVGGAASDWLRAADATPAAAFHSLLIIFQMLNVLLAVSGVTFLLAAYTSSTSKAGEDATID